MEDRVFEIREYLDGRSELVDLEAELGELTALAKRRQDEAEAQKNGEKSEAVRKVLDDLNKKMQDMPTPTAGGDNAELSFVRELGELQAQQAAQSSGPDLAFLDKLANDEELATTCRQKERATLQSSGWGKGFLGGGGAAKVAGPAPSTAPAPAPAPVPAPSQKARPAAFSGDIIEKGF